MYTTFLKKIEEEKVERERGREREEKYEEGSDEFEVENFFCVRGNQVLVLWKYWEEPSWAPISNFARLHLFRFWKLTDKYIEVSEEEEEEDDNDESSEEVEDDSGSKEEEHTDTETESDE